PSASTRPSSCHQATRLPGRPTPGRFNGVHLGTGPRRAGSRTVAAAASADQQYELPAHVTVLADAVRLRDLGEREGLRDREAEAPGLDQLADPGDRVDRAAGVPAAEPHPVLLRATEGGDRHDVLRAAREIDALGQHAVPGHVQRDVAAAGRARANPPGEALAV